MKWNIIYCTRDQGGLGIEVLEIKNKCTLGKWMFKLLNKDGACQELLHNKYFQHKTLSQVQAKVIVSPFWKGLMGAKQDFSKRGSFVVGDGESTRFCEDS
jgi:hypothetical protein